MSNFVPKNGPVVADTVYCDNNLVARDVAVTLPEVSAMTVDIQAMGTMSVPVWPMIENMETSVNMIGADSRLRRVIKPDMKPLEFRWVQTVTDANGKTKNVGCKAFIKGQPTKIPGISLEVGSQTEGEVTIMTTRYNLFVDGKEVLLIDRLAGICRVAGKDYAGNIDSML